MCGIFGFAGSPDRQLLGRMAAVQTHRGPDDAGSFERDAVSTGKSSRNKSNVAGHGSLIGLSSSIGRPPEFPPCPAGRCPIHTK